MLSVVVWSMESFLPISTVSSAHPPSQFCPWWTRLSFCLSQSEFVLLFAYYAAQHQCSIRTILVKLFAPKSILRMDFQQRLSLKTLLRYTSRILLLVFNTLVTFHKIGYLYEATSLALPVYKSCPWREREGKREDGAWSFES